MDIGVGRNHFALRTLGGVHLGRVGMRPSPSSVNKAGHSYQLESGKLQRRLDGLALGGRQQVLLRTESHREGHATKLTNRAAEVECQIFSSFSETTRGFDLARRSRCNEPKSKLHECVSGYRCCVQKLPPQRQLKASKPVRREQTPQRPALACVVLMDPGSEALMEGA